MRKKRCKSLRKGLNEIRKIELPEYIFNNHKTIDHPNWHWRLLKKSYKVGRLND